MNRKWKIDSVLIYYTILLALACLCYFWQHFPIVEVTSFEIGFVATLKVKITLDVKIFTLRVDF